MSAALGYAGWAVLGTAALVLWARARRRRHGEPVTLARPGAVLVRLATGPVLRVVLVVAWMWAGWHLFAR